MQSEITSVKRIPLALKIIGLIVGVAALVIGQTLLNVTHYLRLPPYALDSISTINCQILPNCTSILYPNYFLIPFLIVIAATVILIFVLFRAALNHTKDLEPIMPVSPALDTASETLAAPARSTRWRWVSYGVGVLALATSALALYTAFIAVDHYPSPLLWLVAIILWAITFYSLDRFAGRASALTRRELLGLLGYILLLHVLGYIYQATALQSVMARVDFVIVATLLVIVVWRLRRASAVPAAWVIIAIVGLAVYTYNVDSWRYAFLGDEYSFYNVAITTPFGSPESLNLLDSRGVYNAHPISSSLIQDITIKMYGGDIYSWTFSGILMVFFSAAGIYIVIREIKGPGTGLLAVVLYLCGHHLLAFAHIGSNNVQALPVLTSLMAFGILGFKRRSWLAMYLSGFAGAFAFFTIILTVPLIPLPLMLLAIWVFWPSKKLPFTRRFLIALPLGIVFLVGALVTAFPRIVNTGWLSDVAFTGVFRSEEQGLTNPLLQQILPNAMYTLGATFYFNDSSHYTSGPHADPVTAGLMLVGIAGLISILFKRRLALWLILTFLITTFVIGGLVPYRYPAPSRTFVLVAFYGMFAALGAAYLWETVRDVGLRLPRVVLAIGLTVMIAAVLGLNLYQFFYLSELDIPKTRVEMVVREFQETSPATKLYYVANVPNDGNLMMVLEAHQFDMSRIISVMNKDPVEALKQVREEAVAPYHVIIVPDMENAQEWFNAAQMFWPNQLHIVLDDTGGNQFQEVDVDTPP